LDPYIGEIRLVGFNFAPINWAICNGATIPISQNAAFFDLIGTTYGGDGVNTFLLPDLQGRVAVHQGNGFVIGERTGTETVTLSTSQIPAHTHALAVSGAFGNQTAPAGNYPAEADLGLGFAYSSNPNVQMNPQAIGPSGGNQPHDNMQPFLTMNYIIALFGVFPSQN
jgi:microcystin-dependent protein